jgi:hypothetical protein
MHDDITPNGNVSTDIVREQEGWLRDLVRHLVGASDVEDIVQDACVEVACPDLVRTRFDLLGMRAEKNLEELRLRS